MNQTTLLACDMSALTPAQREVHLQVTKDLMPAIQDVGEVRNGYRFRFPNESALITNIAEFISMERLCCPFLDFTLTIGAGSAPVYLSVSGPPGTPEFLQAEFEGAFS